VFFGECTGREIHPKALTLPVDNLLLKRELVAVHEWIVPPIALNPLTV